MGTAPWRLKGRLTNNYMVKLLSFRENSYARKGRYFPDNRIIIYILSNNAEKEIKYVIFYNYRLKLANQ